MTILGTCSEFITAISSCRNTLLKITLTLLLPLSLLFLLLLAVSTRLSGRNTHRIFILFSPDFPEAWIDSAYVTFLHILMFPSTSALFYTIGCAYSSTKRATYYDAMRAIPNAWMSLMRTFLSYVLILVPYTILVVFLFFVVALLVGPRMSNDMGTGILVMAVFLTLWFVGVVYISIVWQLASVVSVMGDGRGFEAMAKSRARTMQGKMGILIVSMYLVLDLSLFWTLVLFQRYVVIGQYSEGVVWKAAFGVVCLAVLCAIFLVGVLVQALAYFVCKSWSHESIDKQALSDHLDALSGRDYIAVEMAEEGVHMDQPKPSAALYQQ